LSRGLNFSVAYTNSKTLQRVNFANPQDAEPQKVVAAWDIPQSLQLNGVYELPFGPGKPLAASAPSAIGRIVGGWQISGITRIQEGFPMNFPANAASTGASPRISNRSLDRWFNTCTQLADNTTRNCLGSETPVWTIRQPFTFQTWSTRLSSVRLPPIRNLDVSVMKYNRIGERFNIIFRTDFLNATNTPQFFGGPETNVNNPNFGHIAGVIDQ